MAGTALGFTACLQTVPQAAHHMHAAHVLLPAQAMEMPVPPRSDPNHFWYDNAHAAGALSAHSQHYSALKRKPYLILLA